MLRKPSCSMEIEIQSIEIGSVEYVEILIIMMDDQKWKQQEESDDQHLLYCKPGF